MFRAFLGFDLTGDLMRVVEVDHDGLVVFVRAYAKTDALGISETRSVPCPCVDHVRASRWHTIANTILFIYLVQCEHNNIQHNIGPLKYYQILYKQIFKKMVGNCGQK